MTERKTYHHGDLRRVLIEAALDIVSEKDVDSVSLREVARRAGVSHAAPYRHFADKETLLVAVATFRCVYPEVVLGSLRESSHPQRKQPAILIELTRNIVGLFSKGFNGLIDINTICRRNKGNN